MTNNIFLNHTFPPLFFYLKPFTEFILEEIHWENERKIWNLF